MSATEPHKEIGKIESTMLGYEDHGILTAFLHMRFGSSGQGVGGYSLDTYDEDRKERVGHPACGAFIAAILKACGVEKWEQLKGRTVFVLRESDRWGARVVGLEPLPTEKGERVLFDDLFAEFKS